MTLFEFLSVAISIVLALSAGQLLSNFREVFEPPRRYWVHATWVVHLLILHVVTWWSLWSFRDVEWTLATFAIILLPPVILFVCSSALVPSETSNVASWEDHFFGVRRWFFSLRSLFIVAAGFRSWLLLGKPVLETPSSLSLPLLFACIAGALIAGRGFHGTLAVVTTALLVLAGLSL